MITIFSAPKPFISPHINIIQRNAILSWKKLSDECEIILLGDDQGVAEAAEEFGAVHIGQIKKNKYGTPLISDIFEKAEKKATKKILVYVNADIILMDDFLKAVSRITLDKFLMVGRRYDLDIKEEIDFQDSNWQEKLKKRVEKEGKLHGYAGIDYFIFSRNLPHNLPSFIVGRPGWDNWLIYRILSLKIPVIDATRVTTVIHQNHESSHLQVKKNRLKKEEARVNLKLAGGLSRMATIRDTNLILTPKGLRNPFFPRIIFAKLSLFLPWRLLLTFKRKILN